MERISKGYSMKLRRTITLEEEDIVLLKPVIDKYRGNISKAIREVIRSHKYTPTKPITPEAVIKNIDSLRSEIINENIGYLIPLPMAFWLAGVIRGIIPPMGLYRVLIDKFFPEVLGVEDVNVETLLEYINPLLHLWGAHGNLKIKSRCSEEGVEIVYEDTGFPGPEIPAVDFSYLLAHEPFLLKVDEVTRTPTFWRVKYKKCASEDEARRGLILAFGENQDIANGIAEKTMFWREIFKFIRENNYDIVILTRSEFSSLCKGEVSATSEESAGEEIAEVLERFGRARRIVKSVRQKSEDSFIFYLPFDDPVVSELIGRWLCRICESCGKKCQLNLISPSAISIKIGK